MVEVRQVVKRYGGHVAVDRVSFRAHAGEIFGLLGPNGAGKSTIIRMVMGILAADAGDVLFDGRPLAEADKERIGYLPEERGLYQRRTVREVLTYLAALKGLPPARSAAAIDAWLERFELADWRDRRVEQLSKGMAQKVQFIAAVVHDPAIVFFDEPFAGIDPVSADVLRACLEELARAGKTVLFSTHLMEHAERICERVHVIDRGRTVIDGRLTEVKDRFGGNGIEAEVDGDAGFLRRHPLVAGLTGYPNYVEIVPAAGVAPERILKLLVGRVRVRRFQVVAPSLHRIFVERVGRAPQNPAAPP